MKEIEITGQLVVAGAGLTGCVAAVRASRDGIKTVLIHDRPVLGGNASKEVGVPPHGASGGQNNCYFRETGLMEELLLENFYRNPEGYFDYWDATLLDFVLAEPNLTLLLNTPVTELKMEGSRIKSVSGITVQAETKVIVKGDYFIDSTGDGVLGKLAGAPFRTGKESKSEFNEPQAPESTSKSTMGATAGFWAVDAGHPIPFVPPGWARHLEKKDFKCGRKPLLYFNYEDDLYGNWWMETGYDLDSVYDAEKIRFEALRIAYGVWDYIKNRGPEQEKLKNYVLIWMATLAGKRESRRFEGDYILTENDLRNQREFADAVAYGGWSLDDHAEKGFDDEKPGTVFNHLPGLYNIPLRCLYSRTVKNLFFAGRDISVTHRALSSTRLQCTCAQTGEVVGKAAGMCLTQKITPQQLSKIPAVKKLQQELLSDDHYIHGISYKRSDDLAPSAKIEASSYLQIPELLKPDSFYSLTKKFLFMFPVTSQLDVMELLLDCEKDCLLPYELMLGDEKGNYIPGKTIYSGRINLSKGEKQWVKLPVSLSLKQERWVFLKLPAVAGVRLHTSSEKLVGVNSFEECSQVMLSGGNAPYDFYNEYSPWVRLNGIWNTKHQNPCFRIWPGQEVYAPQRVTNGYDRPFIAPNIWLSRQTDFSVPEWLQFCWNKPVGIKEIRVSFDTDLDFFLRPMYYRYKFRTFSCCVRDYVIETDINGRWKQLVSITGNYQRFRIHKMACPPTSKLRLVIYKTNGFNRASVYSVKILTHTS